MAFVQLADGELHYVIEGPVDAPVLVLSNSLGTDLHMWDAQMPASPAIDRDHGCRNAAPGSAR